MPTVNKSLLIFFLVISPMYVHSQLNRFGGGLSFSSGVYFNGGASGNPGLLLRGFYQMNDRLFIIPSFTVFNRYNRVSAFFKLSSYMFHFDLDSQYGIIREKPIVLYGLAGLNATTIVSRYTSLTNVGGPVLENDVSIQPGLNLGAGLKLFINKSFDGFLQTKYTAGKFSQFVISIGVTYHPEGNNRRTW